MEAEHEGDIGEWWACLNGYVPLYQPYTTQGGYAEGWATGDPRLKEYFAHIHKWQEENPLPIVLESCGIMEYSTTMIVLPDKGPDTDWAAKSFDPSKLTVTDEELQILKDFLTKYDIECEEEPAWLLSGYAITPANLRNAT